MEILNKFPRRTNYMPKKPKNNRESKKNNPIMQWPKEVKLT
jgi:hypothetical protein